MVADASIAAFVVTAQDQPPWFHSRQLVAPRLLWSETLSALRQAAWRGDMPASAAAEARRRLETIAIEPLELDGHRERAWHIAEQLGWAKTYDAEYVALADLVDAPLLTLDSKLQRGAARIVRTLTPSDLT
jgi:predicted nucleic acid-binding protein